MTENMTGIILLSVLFLLFCAVAYMCSLFGSCPKSKSKVFPYHEFVPIKIRKHMDCCNDYVLVEKCRFCNEVKSRHFVTRSSLIYMKVEEADIDKITQDNHYYFTDLTKGAEDEAYKSR